VIKYLSQKICLYCYRRSNRHAIEIFNEKISDIVDEEGIGMLLNV
jgi:hypothetical protein